MKSKAHIQTPARDLAESKAFYSRLGFKDIAIADTKSAFFTDGLATVELNPNAFARTGLKLAPDAWESHLPKIAKISSVVEFGGEKVISDPNGVRVYLAPNSVELPKTAEPFGSLGRFAGLSIEVSDFDTSLKWWENLGYSVAKGGVDQGWVTMSSGNAVDVSFMSVNTCPHLFPQPGLTYFNSGKNLEVIKKIRDAGIPISEEITCFNDKGDVDNVVIHDPGFTGFFIFND